MLAAPSEWVESFTLVALAVLAAAQQKFLVKIFQLNRPPPPPGMYEERQLILCIVMLRS